MAWIEALINIPSPEPPTPSILVPWDTGTDEEITTMINAYYAGEITLDDVKSVWHVGDKRSISLSAMAATGVTELHHADSYDFVIIDFDHDLLLDSINGITKALITIQQDRILYKNTTDSSYSTGYPSVTDEGGYINSSNVNSDGWNGCARRIWCNSVYYNAFPQYMKDNIKQVYKSTAYSGNTSSPTWTANTDYCFLLSAYEIYGESNDRVAETGNNALHYKNSDDGLYGTITMPTGGTKYSIFTGLSDRYKSPTYGNGRSAYWWTRSPLSDSSTGFCIIDATGGINGASASNSRGIAPACCL